MTGTGIYVRVQRDGHWDNELVEKLTLDELDEFLRSKSSDELRRWLIVMIAHVRRAQMELEGSWTT